MSMILVRGPTVIQNLPFKMAAVKNQEEHYMSLFGDIYSPWKADNTERTEDRQT